MNKRLGSVYRFRRRYRHRQSLTLVTGKMGLEPILPVKQPVTSTMLNFDDDWYRVGTCEQTLRGPVHLSHKTPISSCYGTYKSRNRLILMYNLLFRIPEIACAWKIVPKLTFLAYTFLSRSKISYHCLPIVTLVVFNI